MAAPAEVAGEFERWLNGRLDSLEVDRDVYGVYILGVLQEEESDDEKMDALQGILSAFLDEDSLEDVCKEIVRQWADSSALSAVKNCQSEDEVQAIANMIEKQAQIVVKQKEVTEDEKKRKEALLAHYGNITDEEEYPLALISCPITSVFRKHCIWLHCIHLASILSQNTTVLFKNTNMEDVLNKKKLQREQARVEAQKKKEQDKIQREKDKLLKQERKDREKKRTQKGERKR
ncbi:coiled-coil domain-containing protein 43-like [Scleropages formosus]|uniref:Coiled-coil domain-containing protein 43 n=1 Tax=Scleropages formosus TaxID=113540 RepID=A0A0P7UX95_SCLFO|nr:coiled-coil domain-containing protein 43-like [Scleropages formosus]